MGGGWRPNRDIMVGSDLIRERLNSQQPPAVSLTPPPQYRVMPGEISGQKDPIHRPSLMSRKVSISQRPHTVSQQNTLLFLQFCIWPVAGLIEKGCSTASRRFGCGSLFLAQ